MRKLDTLLPLADISLTDIILENEIMVKRVEFSKLKLELTLAAALLLTAQFAVADQIKLQSFYGGAANVSIKLENGIDYHNGLTASFNESGGAGGFKTYDATTKQTFESWCVDIFHDFSWGNPGATTDKLNTASSIFGQTKANELGSLYTIYSNINGADSSHIDNPAFQLDVWAIVNTPAGSSPSISGPVFTASINSTTNALAQSWLNELGSVKNQYTASIWSVQNNSNPGTGHSWGAQDVVTFSHVTSPVPEPTSYAMLLAGLGLIGFMVRSKKSA